MLFKTGKTKKELFLDNMENLDKLVSKNTHSEHDNKEIRKSLSEKIIN